MSFCALYLGSENLIKIFYHAMFNDMDVHFHRYLLGYKAIMEYLLTRHVMCGLRYYHSLSNLIAGSSPTSVFQLTCCSRNETTHKKGKINSRLLSVFIFSSSAI